MARARTFFPRKGLSTESVVVREQPCGSTRLRWAPEYSEHRRTTARQRGFHGSLAEQLALNCLQARVPLENRRLKIIRQTSLLRAPAKSAEFIILVGMSSFVNKALNHP